MALWTPDNALFNISAWYDASDASTITDAGGGSVSQWDDKSSGTSYDLTQGSGSGQPTTGTVTVNGLNSLDFDGVANCMSSDALATLLAGTDVPLSIYVAMDFDAGNGFYVSFGSSASNNQIIGLGSTFPNARILFRDDANTSYDVTTAVLSRDPSIMALVRDTSILDTYANGTAEYTSSTDFGAITINRFGVGCLRRATEALFYAGQLCEIIITPQADDTATRQKIEGYLAWKWASPSVLPSGHPYELAPPQISVDDILTTAGGNWTKAAKAKVQEGNDFGISGTSEVAALLNADILVGAGGTFDEAARNTDPGEATVAAPTAYLIQNVAKTGTFDEEARNTDPGQSNVLRGIAYLIRGVAKLGTFDATAPASSGNIMEDGAAWLKGKLFGSASTTAVYKRGLTELTGLSVIRAETTAELRKDFGLNVDVRIADFLIREEDLIIPPSLTRTKPQRADEIVFISSDETITYEVLAEGQEDVYRESDRFGNYYRVHTKETGRV